MEKLVTIALEADPPQHGLVEDHLKNLLAHGWRIVSVTAASIADNVRDLPPDLIAPRRGGLFSP
jgi:hypothetical protein